MKVERDRMCKLVREGGAKCYVWQQLRVKHLNKILQRESGLTTPMAYHMEA